MVRGTLFVDTCWLASVRVWQHPPPNTLHFPHQIFLLILLALVKFHVTNTGWLLSGDQYILFTKLVDTASCHLNKGKIICVKEIEELKMKHWNHENQLQMWTNYTVPKKKTEDQASHPKPKQILDILLLNSRSAFWPLSHLILRDGSLYYYLQFTNE